jgi:hypothetical protein
MLARAMKFALLAMGLLLTLLALPIAQIFTVQTVFNLAIAPAAILALPAAKALALAVRILHLTGLLLRRVSASHFSYSCLFLLFTELSRFLISFATNLRFYVHFFPFAFLFFIPWLFLWIWHCFFSLQIDFRGLS